jgi:hypothetical protein
VAVTKKTLKLAAELKAAIDDLLAALTRKLTAGWAAAWDRLEARFLAAVSELLASNDGKWPTRKQINQSARLTSALDAAQRESDHLVDLLRTAGIAAAAHAAKAGGLAQAALIASQLPAGHGLSVVKFADAALEAVVKRTGEQITALSWLLSAEATAAMKAELIRGIQAGAHPTTVARDMVRRVEGEFNGGYARALNIARTELLGAYRDAAMAGQLANSDVLRGWIWTAALTPRTCGSCWSMHGTEHPLDEPGPDDHQSGRCSRTPLTKSWKDLGFNIPEPASLIPDARTTFDALPQADQLRIMGPTRLDLLNRGDIKWGDLSTRRENPGWRPSYNITPVRDLVGARP